MWIALVYMGNSHIVLTARTFNDHETPVAGLRQLRLEYPGCAMELFAAMTAQTRDQVAKLVRQPTLKSGDAV